MRRPRNAFFTRHHAIKTRLVEEEIDKVIASKLAASDYLLELSRLREENAVMRNLLMDLVENESESPMSQPNASKEDLLRSRNTKVQRYREILAESLHVLKGGRAAHTEAPTSSYRPTKS